jgi:hypothetical protein
MTTYQPMPIPDTPGRRATRRGLRVAAAILGLGLTGLAGVAADSLRCTLVQARLSHAVEAAALAGGRVFIDEQRNGHIHNFFAGAFPAAFLGSQATHLAVHDDRNTGTLVVRASTLVPMPFRGAFGSNDVTVEAHAVVRRPTRLADASMAVTRKMGIPGAP